MTPSPDLIAPEARARARALAEQIDDAAVKYDWQGGPSYAATIEPLILSALQAVAQETARQEREAPLCECGHSWESHTGHTVALHLSEREQHDTHCACCSNCGAYRPSTPAIQPATEPPYASGTNLVDDELVLPTSDPQPTDQQRAREIAENCHPFNTGWVVKLADDITTALAAVRAEHAATATARIADSELEQENVSLRADKAALVDQLRLADEHAEAMEQALRKHALDAALKAGASHV